MTTALVASATAVSASFFVASPQAKTVAAQLPEVTRQVKLTAGTDPISLLEGLLALPASVVQSLGSGQWLNELPYLVAQPLAAADSVLYALDTAAAPVVMNGLVTLLSPLATTPVAQALESALQVYFKNAAFPPTGFAGSGGLGLNFFELATVTAVDFGAPAFALFPAAVTLLQGLGIPLPLPGTLTPNAATNAALSPAITPAAATPQDLLGGLGRILGSALSTVWNDGAYLASIPLSIGVQTAATLLYYGAAAVFNPPLLFSLLTSYIPNYVEFYVAGGINGFVSTTTQFLSSLAGSLGGLLPAAATPLAAANTPKLQTNSAAAVTPSLSPGITTPQDLIGGLGNVVTGALSTVWNDGAYLVGLPLNVGIGVGWPLLTDGPALLFHPDLLAKWIASYALPVVQASVSGAVNGIVSTTTQFLSSLGGLASAAAAPLAAASVPKLQPNLVKVSNPTAAVTSPNAAIGSKSDKPLKSDQTGTDQTATDKTAGDKTGSDKTGGDKSGSDKTGSDKSGSDKTGSDKTGSDNSGKHSKPADAGSNGSAQTGAGAGKAGETKSGSGSHDGDSPKHSTDKSGSSSGEAHGAGGGHGSGK